MAKHVLHTTDDDLDFLLMGIVCPESQYSVCSLVSDALGITLFLSDYVPLTIKDGKAFKFSLFRYVDEALGLEYFMIPNTSNFEPPGPGAPATDLFGGVEVDERVKLVKELPKTDYFVMLRGEELHNYRYRVMDALKTVPDFLQIQAIEPADLPSRKNLIF